MTSSGFIFWPWFAGLVFFVLGLVSVRKQLSFKLENLTVLGRVFVAASLALFGAEHLAGPKFLMQLVPPWMPGRLFWAYFVGFALLAAATSIVLNKYVCLSASLLGLMLFLFVVMIHAPNVVANPGDRIVWAVALRDLSFACGAWALSGNRRLLPICLVVLGAVFFVFGVEHFLHPGNLPGVPLAKMTPAWVPLRPLWGYLTGALLLLSGAAFLVNKQARTAGTWLGIVLALIVAFIYLPILALAAQGEVMEALNYIADTLLFAGMVLIAARAVENHA